MRSTSAVIFMDITERKQAEGALLTVTGLTIFHKEALSLLPVADECSGFSGRPCLPAAVILDLTAKLGTLGMPAFDGWAPFISPQANDPSIIEERFLKGSLNQECGK